MAIARLINPVEFDTGTAYMVETWPFEEARFDAPDGRSWKNFVLEAGVGAQYEWRTPNDHIRAIAKQLEAGAITPRKAARDAVVREWVDRHGEVFVDVFQDEYPKLRNASDVTLARRMLLEVGVSLEDGKGGFAYYNEEDDACASDAAEALELPSWAEITTADEGGPGSGYTATYVVLAAGKTLGDLASWFESRTKSSEPEEA